MFKRILTVSLLLGFSLSFAQVEFDRPFIKQWFSAYRQVDEIDTYMKHLFKSKNNLELVQLVTIGKTVEGIPIRCLRISGSLKNYKKRTRGLLLTAGVHGREWISPMTLLYVTSRILEDYGKPGNATLNAMMDKLTLHIIPLVNGDGFKYTWSDGLLNRITMGRLRLGTHTSSPKFGPGLPPRSRLWRKNRHVFSETAIGVDLNRNFGHGHYNWGKGVHNPEKMNYLGPRGFSEPETKCLDKYVRSRKDVNGFLDIHCCGRYIVAPFKVNLYDKHTADRYARVGESIAHAMYNANKRPHAYRRRKPGAKNSGISSGWALEELGIEYSFTVELGGNPSTMCLPAAMILYEGEELLAGVLVSMAEAATTIRPVGRRVIFRGNKGTNVILWNKFLVKKKLLEEDKMSATYTSDSIAATLRFQKDHQLNPTGMVDEPTFKAAESQGFYYEYGNPRISRGAELGTSFEAGLLTDSNQLSAQLPWKGFQATEKDNSKLDLFDSLISKQLEGMVFEDEDQNVEEMNATSIAAMLNVDVDDSDNDEMGFNINDNGNPFMTEVEPLEVAMDMTEVQLISNFLRTDNEFIARFEKFVNEFKYEKKKDKLVRVGKMKGITIDPNAALYLNSKESSSSASSIASVDANPSRNKKAPSVAIMEDDDDEEDDELIDNSEEDGLNTAFSSVADYLPMTHHRIKGSKLAPFHLMSMLITVVLLTMLLTVGRRRRCPNLAALCPFELEYY